MLFSDCLETREWGRDSVRHHEQDGQDPRHAHIRDRVRAAAGGGGGGGGAGAGARRVVCEVTSSLAPAPLQAAISVVVLRPPSVQLRSAELGIVHS